MKPERSSNNGTTTAVKKPLSPVNNNRTRRPVIIYTHLPYIIHIRPQDFMSLVQKLTGFVKPVDPNPEIEIEMENGSVDLFDGGDFMSVDNGSITSLEQLHSPPNILSSNTFIPDLPVLGQSDNSGEFLLPNQSWINNNINVNSNNMSETFIFPPSITNLGVEFDDLF